MTKHTTVFALRLHNSTLAIYTNLLHCFKHLQRVTPIKDLEKMPSYNTFNRRLQSVGSVLDVVTSIGTFSVEHHELLKVVVL